MPLSVVIVVVSIVTPCILSHPAVLDEPAKYRNRLFCSDLRGTPQAIHAELDFNAAADYFDRDFSSNEPEFYRQKSSPPKPHLTLGAVILAGGKLLHNSEEN